jgi:hypothetical protein
MSQGFLPEAGRRLLTVRDHFARHSCAKSDRNTTDINAKSDRNTTDINVDH